MTKNAKVRYPSDKQFETKYGSRVNVVAETDDGVEVKVWENAGHWIETLEKGQRVQVNKDDKGNWHISKPETNGASTPAKPDQPRSGMTLSTMSKEEKLQLDNELQSYAKLHARCWALALEQGTPEGVVVTEETLQKIATTLFIQACRRFQL